MANLKSIKKGDKVILRMFTGAFVEAKEVEMADAKKIGFTNKKGVKMVFDKATGKQISPEPKNEKYANYIEVYDAKAEAEALKKREAGLKKAQATTKKAAKKKAAKAEPVEDTEEYEDDEDDGEDDDGEEEELD